MLKIMFCFDDVLMKNEEEYVENWLGIIKISSETQQQTLEMTKLSIEI